jgi:hypothetical protein
MVRGCRSSGDQPPTPDNNNTRDGGGSGSKVVRMRKPKQSRSRDQSAVSYSGMATSPAMAGKSWQYMCKAEHCGRKFDLRPNRYTPPCVDPRDKASCFKCPNCTTRVAPAFLHPNVTSTWAAAVKAARDRHGENWSRVLKQRCHSRAQQRISIEAFGLPMIPVSDSSVDDDARMVRVVDMIMSSPSAMGSESESDDSGTTLEMGSPVGS